MGAWSSYWWRLSRGVSSNLLRALWQDFLYSILSWHQGEKMVQRPGTVSPGYARYTVNPKCRTHQPETTQNMATTARICQTHQPKQYRTQQPRQEYSWLLPCSLFCQLPIATIPLQIFLCTIKVWSSFLHNS